MKINSILESYKTMKILLWLYENKKANMLEISKKTDITYSHAVKIIRFLTAKDCVTMTKTGRERIITITKKGNKIAKLIKKIIECEENV